MASAQPRCCEHPDAAIGRPSVARGPVSEPSGLPALVRGSCGRHRCTAACLVMGNRLQATLVFFSRGCHVFWIKPRLTSGGPAVLI